jgi:hypothetical protein
MNEYQLSLTGKQRTIQSHGFIKFKDNRAFASFPGCKKNSQMFLTALSDIKSLPPPSTAKRFKYKTHGQLK